jgi:hypothetical protein
MKKTRKMHALATLPFSFCMCASVIIVVFARASAAQLRHCHLSGFLSFYITTTGFPPCLGFRIASVNQDMIPN